MLLKPREKTPVSEELSWIYLSSDFLSIFCTHTATGYWWDFQCNVSHMYIRNIFQIYIFLRYISGTQQKTPIIAFTKSIPSYFTCTENTSIGKTPDSSNYSKSGGLSHGPTKTGLFFCWALDPWMFSALFSWNSKPEWDKLIHNHPAYVCHAVYFNKGLDMNSDQASLNISSRYNNSFRTDTFCLHKELRSQ